MAKYLKEFPVTDILFFRFSFGHFYPRFLFADALLSHGQSKLSTSGFL